MNKRLQVIAFTNRITVGISYELNDFDHIFIYGTPGSVLPRLLFQMKGRIRNIKNDFISIYILQRKDYSLLISFNQLIKNCFSRRQILSRLKQIESTNNNDNNNDNNSMQQSFQSWMKEWINWQKEFPWMIRQYSYHELEVNLAKRNFLFEMIKLCLHHGYNWVFLSCYDYDFLFPIHPNNEISNLKEDDEPTTTTTTAVNFNFLKQIQENDFISFANLKLLPRSELRKEDIYQSQKEKLQIRKSKLYFTFVLKDFFTICDEVYTTTTTTTTKHVADSKFSGGLLTLKQNEILWEHYKVYNNNKLRTKIFHNFLLQQFPDPLQWTFLLNSGSTFHIGQEFAPKQVVLYKLLFELCSILGFKKVNDYQTIVETETSFKEETKRTLFIKKINEYQILIEGGKKKIPSNSPGLIRRLNLYLKHFSGQTIIPYCLLCFSNGPCNHIKKTGQVQYRQIYLKENSGKTFKLYCFTYKISPSDSDDFLRITQEAFS